MNLFDLFVKISADTKEAESGIDATGEKMKDVAKSAGDMAKSVGEAFKKVGEAAKEIDSVVSGVGDKIVKAFAGAATAVGGFAVGLAKAGVEYNAQMETYQMAFTTLLGSAEEARSAMAQIQADAASTPFDVAGLTQANQLLVGAGVSAEEARNVIMALGDAVSATGGGNDELSRMAANLQQIKNVGQASAVDVKQFAMAGINIYQVLADQMGITVEEASQLKPTYEQLSAALISAASEGGRYFGAMENQSMTFNGQISNLEDNWSALLGSVTGGLQTILQGDILPRIIGYVDEIQTSFNAGGFSGLAATLGDIFADALNTVLGYLPGFVTGVTDTLVSLVSSIDVGQVVSAFQQVVGSIFSAFDEILPMLAPMVEQIVPALAQAFIQYQGMLREIGLSIITAIAQGLADSAPEIVSTIAETLGSLGESIVTNVPTLIEAGTTIMQAIIDGISSFDASAFVDGVMVIFDALVNAITTLLPTLITTVSQIVADLAVAFTDPSVLQNVIMGALAIITALAEGLMQALPVLMGAAMQIIQNLVSWFADTSNLTQILQAAANIVLTLVNGIVSALPQIAEAAVGVIQSLVSALVDPGAAAQLATTAIEILTQLTAAMVDSAPIIAEAAMEIILGLVNALCDPANLMSLVDTAIVLIDTLIGGLVDMLPDIIMAAINIVTSFASALCSEETLKSILSAAGAIIAALIKGILTINLRLSQTAWDIIVGLCKGILSATGKLVETAFNAMLSFAQALIDFDWKGTGIKIVDGIKSGISSAWEGLKKWFSDLIGDLVGIGTGVVDGVKNGISNAWNGLKSLVRGKSESIEDTARDALDTHSPSRVMMRVGRDVVDGLIVGWNDRMKLLQRLVNDDAHALGVGMYGSDFARTPYEGSTAYAAAAVARDFAPEATSGGTYTINIQLDGQTIASAVFDPLRAEAKRRGEALA